MKEKKTTTITIKTTESTKKQLEAIANEKDWSISQVCHNIINSYIQQQSNPEQKQEEVAK